MKTTVLHEINWGEISRDPLKIRSVKCALRGVLRAEFPDEDLVIDDDKVFLFSARKHFERKNNEEDTKGLENFMLRYVIPDHVRYWIERGPEELVRSLL